MTVFDVVILPGILIALFLGGVLGLLGWAMKTHIRQVKAQTTAAAIPAGLLQLQAIAIQDTVAELETNKLTYGSVFPPEIQAELLDAHRAWADSQKNTRGRKGTAKR
jgi:hypothetical protein